MRKDSGAVAQVKWLHRCSSARDSLCAIQERADERHQVLTWRWPYVDCIWTSQEDSSGGGAFGPLLRSCSTGCGCLVLQRNTKPNAARVRVLRVCASSLLTSKWPVRGHGRAREHAPV